MVSGGCVQSAARTLNASEEPDWSVPKLCIPHEEIDAIVPETKPACGACAKGKYGSPHVSLVKPLASDNGQWKSRVRTWHIVFRLQPRGADTLRLLNPGTMGFIK